MRPYLLLIVLFFCSCGIVVTIKRNKFIESKGYDPDKDTVIVKPYEYYIKSKGFVPIYQELSPRERLDLKISIQGFEDSDTLPFGKLFEQMKFVISDSSGTISYGELHFSRLGTTPTIRFGKQFPDSCSCNASFVLIKNRFRKKMKDDILFFWNVNILRGGVIYTLPSRIYYLK
jgi:hypothetical protein